MVNFAELLKDDGVARDNTQQKMLNGIIDEGGRIARIVRDLLTFARQDPYMPVQIALGEVLENSVSLFGHQLEKEKIEVVVDVAEDTLPVRADVSRIRQRNEYGEDIVGGRRTEYPLDDGRIAQA